MKNGTEAKYIGKDRPTCPFCEHEGEPGVLARYDGRIRGITSWAYMCTVHFEEYGVGLGTGKGQRLIFQD